MTSSLPQPVGPVSGHASALLDARTNASSPRIPLRDDPFDHDLQLGLYMLNELHFGGWGGVSDTFEWQGGVAAFRSALSAEFERRLRCALPAVSADPREEAHRLLALGGPSVSGHLRDNGTIEQVRESMIMRTPYQSKEADPHTFALPRFSGTTKRVFTEIQSGEYGVGHRCSHAELFADAMEGLGLDATPNAHVNSCTGVGLATSNLVTLGAMQRRLRGIVLGQLSLFEMDSVVPNRAMVECCDRLGLDASVRPFFHIHVMADTEHEQMVEQAFLTDYPVLESDQVDNLLLGLRAQSMIDHAIAAEIVPAWESGRSALSSVRLENERIAS